MSFEDEVAKILGGVASLGLGDRDANGYAVSQEVEIRGKLKSCRSRSAGLIDLVDEV